MPDPKVKGKLGFLKKKTGPLPVWMWGAIVLALVGAYLLLRRTGSGGGTEPSPALITGTMGSEPVGPQDAAYGGYPAAATAPQQMLEPGVVSELRGQPADPGMSSALLDPYSYQATPETDFSSKLTDLTSAVDALTATITLGPPGASAPTASNPVTRTQGVKWGGRNFTSRAALGGWLKSHGSSYQVWAQRHPEAAGRLKGPAPAPPKRKPAPKKVAPKPTRKPPPKQHKVVPKKPPPKKRPPARPTGKR